MTKSEKPKRVQRAALGIDADGSGTVFGPSFPAQVTRPGRLVPSQAHANIARAGANAK